MKTIRLLVEIEVPDDYIIDEPEWTLEDAVNGSSNEKLMSVNVFKNEK